MMIPETVLGMVVHFSPVPLYWAYEQSALLHGFDVMADQKFAGAMMWAIAMVLDGMWMMVAAIEWWRDQERETNRRAPGVQGVDQRMKAVVALALAVPLLLLDAGCSLRRKNPYPRASRSTHVGPRHGLTVIPESERGAPLDLAGVDLRGSQLSVIHEVTSPSSTHGPPARALSD